MRLRVKGVETVEITDPNRLCGPRKKLDQGLLQRLKGQDFTAVELKRMFGYAKTTALADTQLRNYVEAVNKKIRNPYEEKATRWRVI